MNKLVGGKGGKSLAIGQVETNRDEFDFSDEELSTSSTSSDGLAVYDSTGQAQEKDPHILLVLLAVCHAGFLLMPKDAFISRAENKFQWNLENIIAVCLSRPDIDEKESLLPATLTIPSESDPSHFQFYQCGNLPARIFTECVAELKDESVEKFF